jgi:WD40 repeat protein
MVLEEHTGELRRVAFLNEGVRAVTTADDGTLRLWDLATGACTLVMDGRGGMVTAAR